MRSTIRAAVFAIETSVEAAVDDTSATVEFLTRVAARTAGRIAVPEAALAVRVVDADDRAVEGVFLRAGATLEVVGELDGDGACFDAVDCVVGCAAETTFATAVVAVCVTVSVAGADGVTIAATGSGAGTAAGAAGVGSGTAP